MSAKKEVPQFRILKRGMIRGEIDDLETPAPAPPEFRHNFYVWNFDDPNDHAYDIINIRIIWVEYCHLMNRNRLCITNEGFIKSATFRVFLNYMEQVFQIEKCTWWLERYPNNPAILESHIDVSLADLGIANGSTLTMSHPFSNAFVRGLPTGMFGPGLDKF